MTEQAIELLRKQAALLDAKEFDLRIWKKQTHLLLHRIFGEHDPKAIEIDKLEYEFNSWSLRDASGNQSYESGFKKTGKAILELAITELQTFGMSIPEKKDENATLAQQILSLIFDEMKGSQVKSIHEILRSGLGTEETHRRLKEQLEALDRDTMSELMAGILMLIETMDSVQQKT
jgi:hypothetical protein